MATTSDARPRDRIARSDLRRAVGPRDLRVGAALIEEYLVWVEAVSGHRLRELQPALVGELRDLERWYTSPHGALLLAELDGQALGVAGVHLRMRGVAELTRLYVQEEGRGHAFGERLSERAPEEAKTLGARDLAQHVTPDHAARGRDLSGPRLPRAPTVRARPGRRPRRDGAPPGVAGGGIGYSIRHAQPAWRTRASPALPGAGRS
jgi:GNAT superfamily N-acetyltransferase